MNKVTTEDVPKCENYKELLKKHQEKFGDLWDADENCWHEEDPNCFSGIRCIKCKGWFCY